MQEIVKLSKNDIEYLKIHHPLMVYEEDKNLIKGLLGFNLQYKDCEAIEDEYQIEISLSNTIFGLPKIRETGGRLIEIARRKKMKPVDLHYDELSNELCIIIPAEIKEKYPNGFDIGEFFNHIEEHLYWISHVDKFDKEPWSAYAHGNAGYIELYQRNPKAFKEHFNCHTRAEIRRTIDDLKKRRRKA